MAKGFSEETLDATRFLYTFLRNTTTGGTIGMANHATTAAFQIFRYTVPAGKTLYLYRSNIMIADTLVSSTKFGGIAALTTGITAKIIDTDLSTTVLDFLDGSTIKRNIDFANLAGIDLFIDAAPNDDSVRVRWTHAKAAGVPITMKAGQIFELTMSEDLSGITDFRWMLQGRII